MDDSGVSEGCIDMRELYQGEAPEPTVRRVRLVPYRITATCGVCGAGMLTCYMDGGNAWLHNCDNCNVHQWFDVRFPRTVWEEDSSHDGG